MEDIELPNRQRGSFQARAWARKGKERTAWPWQCREKVDILTPNGMRRTGSSSRPPWKLSLQMNSRAHRQPEGRSWEKRNKPSSFPCSESVARGAEDGVGVGDDPSNVAVAAATLAVVTGTAGVSTPSGLLQKLLLAPCSVLRIGFGRFPNLFGPIYTFSDYFFSFIFGSISKYLIAQR